MKLHNMVKRRSAVQTFLSLFVERGKIAQNEKSMNVDNNVTLKTIKIKNLKCYI